VKEDFDRDRVGFRQAKLLTEETARKRERVNSRYTHIFDFAEGKTRHKKGIPRYRRRGLKKSKEKEDLREDGS